MGKGPSNGGVVASRGFIFQTIVAEIQCLERDDWDAIKVEPETENDKVDIMLYKDGKKISAIQVKSSTNAFERADVAKWLKNLKDDAKNAENVCLFLVGEHFTPSCEHFIEENRYEIKAVSFKNLQSLSAEILVEYIKRNGDWVLRAEDRKFINDALFAKLFTNSISVEPVSRREFKEQFQRALPVHIIPKCLTPVPPVNHVVGLVGRNDMKKTIRDMMEKNGSMALVNGLGGIGKTAVMQHICNDLKNEGKYVAWIECGGSLKEDLLLLRSALGIPESVKSDEAYKEIEKELKANRQLAENLYLFLDNLSRKLSDEEQEILNGLHIHVMATSRFEHDYFMSLPLDVLEETAALDMFYGYYLERQTDKTHRYVEAAKEIIESVQSHTLLVELLAKAAAKKGGTLEDFRDDLKKQDVFDVFKRNLSTKHDRNRTIEECVIELYKISNLSSAQQRIMKLFTIFTPEKEIYYMIGEWADLDMDAMDELVDLGWLEQGGLENGYHIHQIIRDSTARQMKKEGEQVRLEDYGDFLDRTIDTDSYLGETITHEKVRERLVLLEDVCRFFDECGRNDIIASIFFNKVAVVYVTRGNYKKAQEYYRKALAICERILGTQHSNTATIYNNIALVYFWQAEYEKAQEYYEKALEISEQVLGTYHHETATTYSNIGMVFYAQSEYEKAKEYNRKALAIRKRILGSNHPDTAVAYNNVALPYDALGEYETAQEYYAKALAIQEQVLEPGHPDIAATYTNIARVCHLQGDDRKAQEYYKKALAIRERVLGMKHPDTAVTYANMARMYEDQGESEKALEYYGKALEINESVLRADHPYLETIYISMADLYGENGESQKALEYYEKGLAIKERVRGCSDPDTARTYNNMAMLIFAQGEYKKALIFFRKAHEVFLSVFGENHPSTKFTKRSIKLMELLLETGMAEDE